MSLPPLPEGYEPHELPADYTGPLWIEGQMHEYGQACATAERDRFAELCDAAQAVITRWDSPHWRVQTSTAEFIARLRASLENLK